MTNKEAFKILRELYQQCCHTDILFHTDETSARCHAVWMAIQALELKIPKKPLRQGKRHFCPTCGKRFENLRPAHCFNGDCHQAIDWGDDNDE